MLSYVYPPGFKKVNTKVIGCFTLKKKFRFKTKIKYRNLNPNKQAFSI